MSASQNTRNISIGGNVEGSSIVMGDGNVVNAQTSATASHNKAKRKLLILASNPKSTAQLRLDQEVRDISEGLARAKHRDQFEIAQRWAVRPRDFQRAMLDESPQIVHFSGHGEGEAGLYFEDEVGNPKLVTASALATLFKLFSMKSGIECVMLNGCYSQVQADAIAQHVPYAIGMSQDIGDKAAIEFAVGFYDALGSGESIEFAYELGKVAMEMSGTGYSEMPLMLKQAP
ncbi:MAG: CHAT domain-containing protein [Cyanobacteria bacterium J06555_13]